MTDTDTDDVDDRGVSTDVDRRRVLKAAGGSVAAVAAFSGTASAHEVDTIAFCGCSQVTVYGIYLTGNPPSEEDVSYEAAVYCDGDLHWRPLSGDGDRQNYDVHADSEVGEDCQIIAVRGTNWDGNKTVEFTICNEHCPANCAEKGLADTTFTCDDPDKITSPTFREVEVQCSGCGREEAGQPGRGGGGGNGQGNGNGRGR